MDVTIAKVKIQHLLFFEGHYLLLFREMETITFLFSCQISVCLIDIWKFILFRLIVQLRANHALNTISMHILHWSCLKMEERLVIFCLLFLVKIMRKRNKDIHSPVFSEESGYKNIIWWSHCYLYPGIGVSVPSISEVRAGSLISLLKLGQTILHTSQYLWNQI